MEERFSYLTAHWLERAHVYHGGEGELRFRFVNDDREKTVTASAYSGACYEVAKDVETETFPWNDEGVKTLRSWLCGQYAKRFGEDD